MNTARDPRKLLFICSANRDRSPTAERLFENDSRFTAISAGTYPDARVRVSEKDLDWADMIFCMEQQHVDYLRDTYGDAGRWNVVCLDVPDRFIYMDEELVAVLRQKLAPWIEV